VVLTGGIKSVVLSEVEGGTPLTMVDEEGGDESVDEEAVADVANTMDMGGPLVVLDGDSVRLLALVAVVEADEDDVPTALHMLVNTRLVVS